MTDNTDHFDEFEPHTRLKHRVLDTYLLAWCMKLTSGPRGEQKLWFLDGFAGAGQDQKGNPGSPMIACNAAIRIRRTPAEPSPDLGVFCVEKERQYFDRLCEYLAPFRDSARVDLHVRHGEFTEHAAAALQTINGRPVLAFLDPFGIKGLSADLYKPLLAVRRSEIFMLVADAGAARLSGVLNANDRKFEEVTARILAAPSLFAQHDVDDLQANEEARVRREAILLRTREGILRTLREALGDEQAAELATLPLDEMSTRYVQLLEQVLRDAGATHIVKFRVRDVDGNEKHLLLHACTSKHGAVTMKESISSALKDDRLPTSIRARLAEDLRADTLMLLRACENVYAGRTVPLGRDADESLQFDLLENTPLFPHQWREFKERLTEAGYFRRINRKEHAVFPPHQIE